MNIIWETDPPPDRAAVERRLIAEIEEFDMNDPRKLIFHHMPITPGDWDGPAIYAEGCEDGIAASYFPEGEAT